MYTKLIPCIHFHLQFNLGENYNNQINEYENLSFIQWRIFSAYDEAMHMHKELTKEGWSTHLSGNSLDFYKLDINNIKDLQTIVDTHNYRKIYGNNFSIVNQLLIFNNMTKQELINNLNQSDRSLVVFSTPNCGPCRVMKPKIENVVKETKVNLIKINAAEESEIAAEFDVQAVPTMIFFKKDQEYSRKLGIMSEENLKKELEVE